MIRGKLTERTTLPKLVLIERKTLAEIERLRHLVENHHGADTEHGRQATEFADGLEFDYLPDVQERIVARTAVASDREIHAADEMRGNL